MLGEQSELRCNWVATHINQKRIWELAKYYFKVHGSDIILLDHPILKYFESHGTQAELVQAILILLLLLSIQAS